MGLFRKFFKQIVQTVTRPLTRSARYKVEDSYRESLGACGRQERQALQQLEAEVAQEHKKVNEHILELEKIYKNKTEQYSLQKNQLEKHFAERKREIEQAKIHIKNTFDALRAGLEACRKGDIDMVAALLKKGGDIKARFLALHPLHVAASYDQAEIIRLLCRHGADVFDCLESEETPFIIARDQGQEAAEYALREIVLELVRFCAAVDVGDIDAMQLSFERGTAINSTLPDGSNILKQALLERKSFSVIRWLVDAGIDLQHPGFNLPIDISEPPETVEMDSMRSSSHEGRTVPGVILQQKKAVKRLIGLTEQYIYDWHIKDYISDKLQTMGLSELSQPVVEWQGKESRECLHLISHIPYAVSYTSKDNPNRCSAIVNIKGKKQLFCLAGTPSSGINLISYDFHDHQWFRHFMLGDPPVQIGTPDRLIWEKSATSDKIFQTHFKSQVPIQLIKTENNQDQLYLLTQTERKRILLWRFDPNLTRDRFSYCSEGPTFEDYWTGNVAIHCAMSSNKKDFYLLAKRKGIVEIYRYEANRNFWKPYPCEIRNATEFEPQMTVVRDSDGFDKLFVLLERAMPADSKTLRKVELWSFDILLESWTSHDIGADFSCYHSKVQMKQGRVKNQPHLYILRWPMKEAAFSPEFLQFDCQSLSFQRTTMSGIKLEEYLTKSIVQLEFIPSYDRETDIPILLKLNESGLNTYARHPLSKKETGWLWVHQNVTDQFKLRVAEDPDQRILMHLEMLRNQPQIILFNEEKLPKPEARCLTLPISVAAIEKVFNVLLDSDPRIEWRSKEFLDGENLISHFPFSLAYTRSDNPNHFSATLAVKGKKQLFSLGNLSYDGINLISYDFESHKWFKHFVFNGTTPFDISDREVWRRRVAGDKLFQDAFTSHVPLGLIKAKNKEDHIYLLTQENGQHILLWRFEPNLPSDKFSHCADGPVLEDYLSRKIFIAHAISDNGDNLYLLARRENRIDLWCYNANRDSWKQYPCDIKNIANFFEPQITVVQNSLGEEKLFALLERRSVHPGAPGVLELWSFDSKTEYWSSHGNLDGFDSLYTKIQMKQALVYGKPHLFILRCPLGEISFSSEMLQFDSENLTWGKRVPVPGILASETALSSITQLETVYDADTDSDILILLKLTPTGLRVYAYHTIYKKDPSWTGIDYAHLSQGNLRFRGDLDQKILVQIDIIHDKPHIVLFSQDILSSFEGQCMSFPLDVWLIKQEISRNRRAKDLVVSEGPIYLLSKAEVRKQQDLLTGISKANQTLLEAASCADWPQMLSSIKMGANIYSTDSSGRNALQLAACHPIDRSTLTTLIESGFPLTYRDKQGDSALDIARKANQHSVSTLLADILNKRHIQSELDIDPINQTKIQDLYAKHLQKAEFVIKKHQNPMSACQRLVRYLKLMGTTTEPYALYIWPGLILLGEILSLLPKDIEKNACLIEKMQSFFIKTRALHKTLATLGVEHYEIILSSLKPTLGETQDWTHVQNTLRLQELAEAEADKHGLPLYHDEVIKKVYQTPAALALQGMTTTFTALSKALNFDKDGSWTQEISQCLIEKLKNPRLFRKNLEEQFKDHCTSMASMAKEAQKAGMLYLKPKHSTETETKALLEEESSAIEQFKKWEEAQNKELAEWLEKIEKESLETLDAIKKQISTTSELHVEIDRQVAQARSELQAQFANFRKRLDQNKKEALRKIQRQAFKSLVVMAAACVVAQFAAPLLSASLSPAMASFGLETQVMTTILKGAIMGGINGGFSRQNILTSTLKGAGFAALGSGISSAVPTGLKELFPSLSSKPEMFKYLATVLATGLEATARATLEGNAVGKNVIASIGTGLLINKFSDPDLAPDSLSFVEALQGNLLRAFVGGSIHAAVYKQHIGASLMASAMTAGLTTAAEGLGSRMAAPVLTRMQETSIVRGLSTQFERMRFASRAMSSKEDAAMYRKDITSSRHREDFFATENTHSRTEMENNRRSVVFSQKIGKGIRTEYDDRYILMPGKGKTIHRFETTQDTIDYRILGARAVVDDFYSPKPSVIGSKKPIYSAQCSTQSEMSIWRKGGRLVGRLTLDTMVKAGKFLQEYPRVAIVLEAGERVSDAFYSYVTTKAGTCIYGTGFEGRYNEEQQRISSVMARDLAKLERTYSAELGLNKEDKAAIGAVSLLFLGSIKSKPSGIVWTTKARLKKAQLPIEGRMRFVPPENYNPSIPLLRGPNNGYLDRFQNEWVKGPSRTLGEPFEWDVQLSKSMRRQFDRLSRDGNHINVSLKGHVTHR